MESSSSANLDWESRCANVKPLKKGRKVDSLTIPIKDDHKIADEKFESFLQACSDVSEPLEAAIDFCRWFENSFPLGKQMVYYKYLWKIVHTLVAMPRYLDDERLLDIWEKLADNSSGHDYEIYQHANSIGSLLRCARLYVLWAQDMERRGCIGECRSILHRAKTTGAIPLELILEEEDRMELREMRRRIEDVHDEVDSDGEERIALTRISALGGDQHNVAPVVRLPSVVGEQGRRGLNDMTKQKPVNNGASTFEVFVDDNSEDNYLENIYEMNNHMEKLSMKDMPKEKLNLTKLPLKKLPERGVATFCVYNEDQNGAKKARLMLKRELIRDLSIEEAMAEKYENQIAAAKLNAVVKRLSFSD